MPGSRAERAARRALKNSDPPFPKSAKPPTGAKHGGRKRVMSASLVARRRSCLLRAIVVASRVQCAHRHSLPKRVFQRSAFDPIATQHEEARPTADNAVFLGRNLGTEEKPRWDRWRRQRVHVRAIFGDAPRLRVREIATVSALRRVRPRGLVVV